MWATAASAAAPTCVAQTPATSRDAAIRQLDTVRESIDRTLSLIKDGHTDQAYTEAKSGYLSHFEYVEIPLRVVDPQLTSDAETKFAEIRGLISSRASTGEIRSNIVELRALIDDAERHLTDTGLGAPAVVFGQSFLIIFREGLEAVLLVSVLLGYLEAAKATQYRRPILWGMGAAVLATVATFFVLRTVLSTLPFGREILEAITALLAVAVLFYVSFWLIARLEQKRWLEFLRARVWSAVSVGSTAALMLVGFTAIYREGFETALFYQALLSFGPGLGIWVAAGLLTGVVALAAVAWMIFKLGRRIPLKAFLSTAVVLLMATSVAFLGNAVRVVARGRRHRAAPVAGLAARADLPVAVPRLLAEPRDHHCPTRAHHGVRGGRAVHVRRASTTAAVEARARSAPAADDGAAAVPTGAGSAVSVGSRR